MPTIKSRKKANGVTRYTAIVRIRRGTAIIHRESKTRFGLTKPPDRKRREIGFTADLRD